MAPIAKLGLRAGATKRRSRAAQERRSQGAEAASKDQEDGEVAEAQPANVKEKPKDKKFLGIHIFAASPASFGQSRR
jgi:hypothetical protein